LAPLRRGNVSVAWFHQLICWGYAKLWLNHGKHEHHDDDDDDDDVCCMMYDDDDDDDDDDDADV